MNHFFLNNCSFIATFSGYSPWANFKTRLVLNERGRDCTDQCLKNIRKNSIPKTFDVKYHALMAKGLDINRLCLIKYVPFCSQPNNAIQHSEQIRMGGLLVGKLRSFMQWRNYARHVPGNKCRYNFFLHFFIHD